MTTMENANTSSKALADKVYVLSTKSNLTKVYLNLKGSRVTKMPAKAPTAEERFAKLKVNSGDTMRKS